MYAIVPPPPWRPGSGPLPRPRSPPGSRRDRRMRFFHRRTRADGRRPSRTAPGSPRAGHPGWRWQAAAPAARSAAGLAPATTLSWATWSMLRGAPDAANSATARASALGVRVAGGPHRREAVIQVRPRHALPHAAERLVRPCLSSAAAAASTPSHSQSASRAPGPAPSRPARPGRAGRRTVPTPLPARPVARRRRARLPGGRPRCAAAATCPRRRPGPHARPGPAHVGQPGLRHMTLLLLVAEPGGRGDHLPAGQPGSAGPASPAARCPAAQRPSEVIAGLPGSSATAPKPAAARPARPAALRFPTGHTGRPPPTAPTKTCRTCRTAPAAPRIPTATARRPRAHRPRPAP